MLDRALAATAAPAAQHAHASSAQQQANPSSIQQQLQQARDLYGTDRQASWQVVDRLLADVDDAEVRMSCVAAVWGVAFGPVWDIYCLIY